MAFRPELSWEYQSRDEIEQRSIKALRNHVAHLKSTSQYYAQTLADIDPSDINDRNDIAKLPLTSRTDLVNNLQLFWSIPQNQVAEMMSTRGITGLPLVLVLSTGDLERLAFNGALAFHGAGLSREDRAQVLLSLDGLLIAGMSYYRGLNALEINTSRVGHITFDKQKHYLDLLKPTVLIGTPSYLKTYGQRLVESGYDLPNSSVNKIFCVGESIRDEENQLNSIGTTIQEIFDAKLFSGYGVTEFSVLYSECAEQNGCHAYPELIYTEIVDEEGNPVPDGVPGELVGTPLGVEGVPLLRYRSGDITFKVPDTCGCGRNSDRIGPILKRKSLIIKLKDKTAYPSAITGALEELEYVKDYVLMIEGKESFPDQVTLHIVTPADKLESITAHLREKADVSIPIFVSNVATLNSFRGGTRRDVKVIDKRNR